MDTKTVFSGRADAYAKSRPGYPEELFLQLKERNILPAEGAAADIGSGTGIFSVQLLQHINHVFCVEPNADMRQKAEDSLGKLPGFTSVEGSAESTNLPDESVELVTAAQAFHWFEPEAFRKECLRILKPGGYALVLWNTRAEESPLVQALAEVFRKHISAFPGFGFGNRSDSQGLRSFFGGAFETLRIDNQNPYTRESFLQRSLSSSYAPKESDPAYAPLLEGLNAFFDTWSRDGILTMPLRTSAHWAKLKEE